MAFIRFAIPMLKSFRIVLLPLIALVLAAAVSWVLVFKAGWRYGDHLANESFMGFVVVGGVFMVTLAGIVAGVRK